MINGILLINKERNITSYDVIRKLKKVLPKGQKIGHAGTLDPFATGLLIILLGKYTKEMENILKMEKEYLVKAEFGYSTDTQDITGKKIKEVKNIKEISKEKMQEVIQKELIGEILQTPPQFSAKKIKGKKAYEYARKGKKVKLNPKEVNIKRFEVVNYGWPFVEFDIICSSGTYIRTLVHDLGQLLETYATAMSLKRVRIGKYTLTKALNSEDITEGIGLNLIQLEND
jgi:tRNA pseudouridine55 synthase